MDPQQELFTKIKKELEAKGYSVYDGFMPPNKTPYPFIFLGEFQQIDDNSNKTAILGNIFATVHVWHNNPMQRVTMSKILLDIKRVCRSLNQTVNFKWSVRSIDQRILADDTTKTPLMHGILDVEFKFC